ncbi:MAG: glycoside hydrolase [Acidobacteriia bacterium]|nr:glycoside hydrolase [Terriglobia bacterium]
MKWLRSLALALLVCALALAASYDAKFFAELRWRPIGPLRGGRTRAAAGVPGQPNVFYIGVCNGGIWKTNDFGRTWQPIFDDQPTGSIGAIAVAPSDPNIVYAASGEGLHRPDLSTGDGIYKSTDAGKTWTHLGLRDGQQIPQIAIDPRDPQRLFAAVLGHPYGPNEERGIYRSTDGGQTFQKVLSKDENTGGADVAIDPSNPDTVYAAMWEDRQGPWENSAFGGTAGGIFKSTDGGSHWRQLTGGLPSGAEAVRQANLAIAPSDPKRIYASIAYVSMANGRPQPTTAIYRSDDAGESWTRATTDPRPAARIGGGDLSVPAVDPKNADIVYSASVVTWKSIDAGKTWTGIRGAPGGDDYQRIWINPNTPQIMLIVSDQGAIVTVNGGETWSSWYNQPTAQMYHANTDNDFPYRVCSGQQESGSACVSSRGDDGQITFREWHPVGVEEYGYAVPDPLDPNIVFGGKVTRFDRRTGQVQNVAPAAIRPGNFRTLRTAPLVFSQAPGTHVLYFGANTVWQTADGGNNWKQISPDLTRKEWELPASVARYRDDPSAKPTQRGVVYAIAPSPVDAKRIWAGTDDGLIHTTADGGLHWTNVTPPALAPFAKVSVIDAGHADALTAYAAINTLRLDDMRPHILRTRDGGKTWREIVSGIPDGAPVDAVREDPRRKGLLFAGTERAVYVSFDDGDHWQSLRLNMPASSIRDLAIHEDDLVAATHGRGFWILDDITPLRQINEQVASGAAYLFKPQTAVRVRWDMNTDTPLPPDEPALPNPPDGAVIDYYLGAAATGPVTLEILDGAGALVRKYSSADPVEPADPMLAIPTYWVRPPHPLSAEAGMHRFLWDLHYTPLGGGSAGGGRANYPMQAVVHDTAPAITSIWAMPGQYTVRLTASGKSYRQPLAVKMDPRVKTPAAGLQQQFTLSRQLYDDTLEAQKALAQLRAVRAQLRPLRDRAGEGAARDAIQAFDQKAAAIEGAGGGGRGGGGGGRGAVAGGPETLASAAGGLTGLIRLLEGADAAPTATQVAAVADRRAAVAKLIAQWTTLKTADLAALNAQLKQANLPAVTQ